MIDLIKGHIKLGVKTLRTTSNYEDLHAFAEEGLIEKRADNEGTHFYAEAVADDGMRFGVLIGFREEHMHWMVLRWLDGPCTSHGWDGVSEAALREEYRLLLDFVKKNTGASPDEKRLGTRTWRFKWGQLDVSYESRAFDAAIFMKPRPGHTQKG